MNFISKLGTSISLALISCHMAFSQAGNPSVATATLFEQYPVELYTGLPQVSIPLQTLPTRSKDINIDISLNYHQSTIKNSGLRSGNAGRGWYLSLGGVVQKVDGLFSFNFMGYSGKLIALRFTNGNKFTEIRDNKGPQIYAETFFSSDNFLEAIHFYDNKGYKYVFNVVDIINVPREFPNDYIIDAQKLSYHLSDVYDPNGNLLAHFNYTANDDIVKIKNQTKHDIVNTVSSVDIPGFGSVVMDEEKLQDDYGAWHMYNGLVVKDFLNNETKRVVFNYDRIFDYDNQVYTQNKLTYISVEGAGGFDPQLYKFYYRPIPVINEDFSFYVDRFDEWGYPKLIDKYCKNLDVLITKLTDTDNVMNGVLEKIQYPTGGSVVYEYESNTYSYNENGRMDYDYTNNKVIPDFYYNLDVFENRHNYNKVEVVNSTNTTFYFPVANDYYVKLYGEPTIDPNFPQAGLAYPSFVIKNMNTGDTTPLPMSDNDQNFCLGRSLQVSNPNIPFQINKGISGTNTKVSIYSLSLKPVNELKKYWHGGGIRVKTIAFFEGDAPQDYFSQSNPTVSPVKSTYYSYNSFSDPSMSSGVLLYIGDQAGTANVIYSNVRVSDRVSPSRTDYTFYTPADFQGTYNQSNYAYGKLLDKKVYDDQNFLQEQTILTYTQLPATELEEITGDYMMGWMMPSKIVKNENLTPTLTTTEDFEYDTYRNIKKRTVTTSQGLGSLISNYYYHLDANGNPYTPNRVSMVDHIDEFMGTTQLSTSKIEYSNTWTDTQGNNNSYLPSQVLSAKGTGALQPKTKNTKYDLYGNILETEQVNGIKKSFIWGYNNTMIIAEINGVAYDAIPASLITAAKAASDSGNEPNLLTALTNLRNSSAVAAGFITTYTHKPLVGVSTVTDVRGYRLSYEYDASGRQIAVRDQSGNIVTQNFYHTKPN